MKLNKKIKILVSVTVVALTICVLAVSVDRIEKNKKEDSVQVESTEDIIVNENADEALLYNLGLVDQHRSDIMMALSSYIVGMCTEEEVIEEVLGYVPDCDWKLCTFSKDGEINDIDQDKFIVVGALEDDKDTYYMLGTPK